MSHYPLTGKIIRPEIRTTLIRVESKMYSTLRQPHNYTRTSKKENARQ